MADGTTLTKEDKYRAVAECWSKMMADDQANRLALIDALCEAADEDNPRDMADAFKIIKNVRRRRDKRVHVLMRDASSRNGVDPVTLGPVDTPEIPDLP